MRFALSTETGTYAYHFIGNLDELEDQMRAGKLIPVVYGGVVSPGCYGLYLNPRQITTVTPVDHDNRPIPITTEESA